MDLALAATPTSFLELPANSWPSAWGKLSLLKRAQVQVAGLPRHMQQRHRLTVTHLSFYLAAMLSRLQCLTGCLTTL
jgi:hypothetical protein